ncbi:hypothetical protein H2199_003758 [Coniosporium tulheliwenetii]|uniref:Uncharacterized protein n=1 Tax=Coniosporium tulheliwenetii TaxID=3383036 RepID=A0ACC2Z9I7_9PEZI|nr:hypothetical protein H2199_003758 [Cladosporium sp. JES 115]
MATFTARELEILALVHQCFSSDPKVDYEKLATLGGFKNKASASAVWGAIKKKRGRKPPKRGRPAGKAKAANGTKAAKGATRKGGGVKKEPEAAAADDEEALREEEEAEMVRAEERKLVGNLVKKEPEVEVEEEEEVDGGIDWEVEQKRFLKGE